MNQNTTDWLRWRKEGVGSSDLPIILGVSEFKTKFQLWQEKTSEELVEQAPNYIQQKGHDFEPRIRAMFEIQCGELMGPALVQMNDFPWARASLDGRSACKTQICEMKYVGKDDHALAAQGIVPTKYVPQVQWQLMVAQAKLCYYLSFDGNTLNVVKVPPDPAFQGTLLGEATKFWQCVIEKTPVDLSDKDYKVLKFRGAKETATKYKKLKMNIAELEAELEAVEKILLDEAKVSKAHRCIVHDVRMINIERQGNVDYKKVPQLKGVDLDPYRAKSSNYWKIDIKK